MEASQQDTVPRWPGQPQVQARQGAVVSMATSSTDLGDVKDGGSPSPHSAAPKDGPAKLYWKLDAMRSYFSNEITSCAALRDALRFALWIILGNLVDQLLYRLWEPAWEFSQLLAFAGALLALYIDNSWLLGICVGSVVSVLWADLSTQSWEKCHSQMQEYVQHTYTVHQVFAFCVAPLASLWVVLTSRALDRLYGMISPQHDISSVRHCCEADCAFPALLCGLTECFMGVICGRDFTEGCWVKQSRGRRRLHVKIPEGPRDEPLRFYESHMSHKKKATRGCCRNITCGARTDENETDTEIAAGSLPSESESDDEKWNMEVPDIFSYWCLHEDLMPYKDDCKKPLEPLGEAVLIYNPQGGFVKVSLERRRNDRLTATMTLKLEKDETGETLKLEKDETREKKRLYCRIVEAFETNSLLLLYFGEKPILFQPAGETQAWCGWKTKKNHQGDQSDNHRRDPCEKKVRWTIAGIFILLIIAGMILWYVYLNKKPDWIPLVSVRSFAMVWLVLPDLAAIFLERQADAKSSFQKVQEVIKEGTYCVYHGDRKHNPFLTSMALTESTLLITGCGVGVFIACWHLCHVHGLLQEVNDLLHPMFIEDDKEIQAMLVYKLHHIRTHVSNQRCLEFLAEYALPNHLKVDDTLSWWFQTRAAIYSDISLNITKRLPILIICFIGEVILVALTLYAKIFLNVQDHTFLCYSAIYGLGLGVFILAFFILGHRVNERLSEGLKRASRLGNFPLQALGDSDALPVQPAPPVTGLPSGPDASSDASPDASKNRPTLEPRDERRRTLRNAYFHYEENNPLELRFLGLKMSLQYIVTFSGILSALSVSLCGGILPNLLEPVIESLKGED